MPVPRPSLLNPMTRKTFHGTTLTRRTIAMIRYAERIARIGNFVIAQGSYRPATPYSGTTHTREAVDFSVSHLTDNERKRMVHALKDAGFAAFYRPNNWDGKGSGEHVHALPISGDLSPSAYRQVVDYDHNRNALNDHAPDPTYHPNPPVVYSYRAGKTFPRKLAN